MRNWRHSFTTYVRICVALGIIAIGTLPAAAQETCPAANPNDQEPDDVALQACLDAGGTIVLNADSLYGYRISTGLVLSSSGTTLTSTSQWGYKALLVATPDLHAPILDVPFGVSNYTISNIWFNGAAPNRDPGLCNEGFRHLATNVALRGSGLLLDNIDTTQAPCATGMSVEVSGFEIRNSWFAFNGAPQEDRPTWNQPWADGLTVLACDNGYIHDNHFWDNTDVDLVVGGGINCNVSFNIIEHTASYGFAGIDVGYFAPFNGFHNGSVYSNNTITSSYNKLGAGIAVGIHPWGNMSYVWDPVVTSNTISGAVVNLLVDGVQGGVIQGNSMSGAQGSRAIPTCPQSPANYTAGDFSGTSLQSGWIYRVCH